ncbi:hypothetical protein JCM10450v2_008218 [Rhodotorula kratochvilovae]
MFKRRQKSFYSNSSGGDSAPRLSSLPSTKGFSSPSATSLSSGERSPRPRLVRIPGDPLSLRAEEAVPFFAPGTADDGPAFSNFGREDRLKVVIVGTGFAGLAAAIACARQNLSVTVLERSSGLSPHGDSIMFGSNASKLLHRWGVGKEMYARAASKGGWWLFKGQDGAEVWQENVDELPAQYGAPILQGRRASFLGSLGIEARLLGVNIRLEAEVVQYWDAEDEPAVMLRSGEVIRGDVILVADGVHSPARRLLAPHDRPAPPKRPSGYSIHRAVMSTETIAVDPVCSYLLDGNIRTWLGPDAHICTYPMDNGRLLAFTFTHRDDSAAASLDWRDKKPIAEVLAQLSDAWDPSLRKAMAHPPSTLHWKILDETPEEEWISASGKICFIGDSVHAMMPTSFQGGSQAVEDAATIALCLAMAGSDPTGVRVALETHEALRRPRVQQAQSLGRKQQSLWHAFATSSPSSPLVSNPSSLRPLSFSLYAHDAEHFALANFAAFARAIDPDFVVRREWVAQAAENAEIDLRDVQEGARGKSAREGGVRRPKPAK